MSIKATLSALGHKRTYAVQNGMSALPPKADMCSATQYVRFVPLATNALQQTASLFDHLVGAGEQRWRHRKAERLRGFE
ncbi:MAG: hypothetical protein WCD13_20455, partial [Pseudolabrys sp.]